MSTLSCMARNPTTLGKVLFTVGQGRIFIFFHRRGGKILGGVQVMQYAVLDASGGA